MVWTGACAAHASASRRRCASAQVDEHAELVAQLASELGGGEFQWATRQEDRSRLWTLRHHAYFASLQLKAGSRSFTTDACVPISALSECIQETLADIEEHGEIAVALMRTIKQAFDPLDILNPGKVVERV